MTHTNRLMDFQNEGVSFLTQAGNRLLADEPGLGKTVQAIEFLKTIEGRALIVCPATIKHNWLCELVNWGVDEKNIAVIPSKPNPGAKFVIINYDLLEKHYAKLDSARFRVLIFDEAHYLKNAKSKRTNIARKLMMPVGVKTVFLTGTPVLNRPQEFLSLMQLLEPKRYSPPEWWRRYLHYCDAKKVKMGRLPEFWDFSGAKDLDKLREEWRDYILRRQKKDVLAELPDKILQVIEFDDDGNDTKSERQEFDATVKRLGFKKAVEEVHFSTLRQRVALHKCDNAVKHIADILQEEDKVVVFAHHRAVIDALYTKLSRDYQVAKITGDTPVISRMEQVNLFQEGNARVFLGNIQAAGVGITLTAAKTCVFVESSFVPAEITQACDRLHRIGQKDVVRCQFLVTKNSVDALILKVIVKKNEIIKELVD